MPTLNKEMCIRLAKVGGYYIGDDGEKDPIQVSKIVRYDNSFNGQASWAAVYATQRQNIYEDSGVCDNVKTAWLASEHEVLEKNHGPLSQCPHCGATGYGFYESEAPIDYCSHDIALELFKGLF